jgi:hypothetical protein
MHYFSERNKVNNYLAIVKQLKIVANPHYGQIYFSTTRYKGVCEQFIEHIIEGTYPSSDKYFIGVKYES